MIQDNHSILPDSASIWLGCTTCCLTVMGKRRKRGWWWCFISGFFGFFMVSVCLRTSNLENTNLWNTMQSGFCDYQCVKRWLVTQARLIRRRQSQAGWQPRTHNFSRTRTATCHSSRCTTEATHSSDHFKYLHVVWWEEGEGEATGMSWSFLQD